MTINTNPYCLVNVPTANAVLEGPRTLPQNWQDPGGQWHMNLNNNAVWTDAQRIAIGWYPYVESDTGAPGPYYDRSLSDFVINPANVVRNAVYTQWEIERVRTAKNAELEAQISIYTLNDSAINPKVTDYINDDVKWVADKQAELARLTVWADVANFVTTKPAKLVLPNSYVGASYVRQATALTAQNKAATDSSLPAIWDQTIINSFATANQAAANDSSNNTAPVQPVFQIRQGVAVPSEQFNRIVIYRFDRDDPNPALRRSFAMRMTNRQDARNLYVFTYTNSTFLAWHLFELQPDGTTWFWEAFSSEWQYTDTDMGFIFSYGTNPAVEADYFTDRVDFPAGVDQQNIIVAWDQE